MSICRQPVRANTDNSRAGGLGVGSVLIVDRLVKMSLLIEIGTLRDAACRSSRGGTRLRCQATTLGCAILLATQSGCVAVGATMLGVGAAVGVNHTLSGIVYRTFSEPLPKVKQATLTALGQMEIKVSSTEKTKTGELIKATAANRAIEIEFEVLTPKTTRMRVVANTDGLFKDSATATEIILQTERALPAT